MVGLDLDSALSEGYLRWQKRSVKWQAGKKVQAPPTPPKGSKKSSLLKSAPAKPASGKKPDATQAGPNLKLQRYIALFGFGFCGFVAGSLTGLNQLAATPETAEGLLSTLGWTSFAVGDQSLEYGLGLQGGILGAIVGSTMGFSVLMKPIFMLGSWAVAGTCLYLGLQFGGQLWLGAAGWLFGFLPFWLREVRGSDA